MTYSLILQGVGVEGSLFLGRDGIRWRQSKSTGKTVRKTIIVRQYARANNGILAGDNLVSDTTNTENHSLMQKVAEEKTLHRMAKVSKFLELWQGTQNIRATQ
jgi:hypothetical protein